MTSFFKIFIFCGQHVNQLKTTTAITVTGGTAASGQAATLTCELSQLGGAVTAPISWYEFDGNTDLATDTGEYSAVK